MLWYTPNVQKDQDNLEEINCHATESCIGSEEAISDLSSLLRAHLG